MKKIVVSFMSLLITLLPSGQAWAWRHANRWGGSTAHTFGSTTHTGRYGGSVSHTWSGGTSAPNRFGGSGTHYAGGDWTATNRFGTTASGGNNHYPVSRARPTSFAATRGSAHPSESTASITASFLLHKCLCDSDGGV